MVLIGDHGQVHLAVPRAYDIFMLLSGLTSCLQRQLGMTPVPPDVAPLVFVSRTAGDLTQWEGDAIVNAANERVGGSVAPPSFLRWCIVSCSVTSVLNVFERILCY